MPDDAPAQVPMWPRCKITLLQGEHVVCFNPYTLCAIEIELGMSAVEFSDRWSPPGSDQSDALERLIAELGDRKRETADAAAAKSLDDRIAEARASLERSKSEAAARVQIFGLGFRLLYAAVKTVVPGMTMELLGERVLPGSFLSDIISIARCWGEAVNMCAAAMARADANPSNGGVGTAS